MVLVDSKIKKKYISCKNLSQITLVIREVGVAVEGSHMKRKADHASNEINGRKVYDQKFIGC